MGISITQELPINPHKYFTLALGNWDLTLLKLGFGDFSPFEIGILGFHPFGNFRALFLQHLAIPKIRHYIWKYYFAFFVPRFNEV